MLPNVFFIDKFTNPLTLLLAIGWQLLLSKYGITKGGGTA
jgi:hypothetical protein